MLERCYSDDFVTLYHGDCREFIADVVQGGGRVVVVTDPPYGDTSLKWDVPAEGWLEPLGLVADQLWCFGSMRFWLEHGGSICREAGWKYGQEIVWEKHTGHRHC
jgi:site-specific DNA-methyltransferase (adenine-specific)